MANSSRRQIEVKPREDSSADYDGAIDGNPGDFDSDHGLANIQSDVINGEQVRHKIQDAHDLDNEGDVLHAEKSKHSILKSKFKKKGKDSTATVVRLALDNDEEDDDEGEDEDEEEDNENHQQNEDDDGNNTSGRGIKKYAGKKRGETSKMLQSLAKKGNGSSKAMQQGSNSGTQGVTTRRRGRPSKAQAVLGGNATSTVSSSAPARLQAKRKRAAMEAGRDVVGIRRSSRPAAESAAQQISEQSVSFSLQFEQSEGNRTNIECPRRNDPRQWHQLRLWFQNARSRPPSVRAEKAKALPPRQSSK
ncbi:hypothetical protein F5Y19DRAFT_302636 [Xylariaceae sp. FL1651]|nr:hypothetical protein F5Y19DRAFT_302636 [Xylariaceae sp. FL1651]